MKRIAWILAAALSSQLALGAGLVLTKEGGAALKTTTLRLAGGASQPYLILFDVAEAPTVVNPNVTLDVSLTFVNIAVGVPGFLGALDAAGMASASFVIPNDPFFLGLTISLQAIAGNPIDASSNLVRLTPALAGTFEATLDAPDLPVVGGAVAEGADGKLLVVGGSGPVAQGYDPDLEEFEIGGATFGVGVLGQSTALADGRILFTGGLDLMGQPTNAAAVYDPATGQTTTLTMNQPRAGHGASLMANGRVLITGGFNAVSLTDLLSLLTGVQASTEVFDPSTSAFTPGSNMLEPRALHSSTAMSNGRVLVAGGLTVIPILNIPTISNTAYSYNPSTGSFGLPAFFSGPRLLHAACEVGNGKVLLAGGLSLDFSQVIVTGDITQIVIGTLADGQVFTPNIISGSFSTVPGLSQGRAGAGALRLADGGALIAGGFQATFSGTTIDFAQSQNADVFTTGGAFQPTGSLVEARLLPILTALDDGTILVLGGGGLSAEVYQP